MGRKRRTGPLLAAALLLAGLAGCGAQEPQRLTTFAMGSAVRQTVYGEGAATACAAVSQAARELENAISWRVEGSDIARLNAGAGGAVDLSHLETSGLLALAGKVSAASGGAFDVTIGPVSRLWDFDGDPHVPDPEELAAALALVDYRKLSGAAGETPDGPARYLLPSPGMAVDLGAMGKGAACDAALRRYRQDSSVEAAVIAVGGSVAVYGQKPDGKPWRIAVRDPRSDGTLGEIEMNSGYVSTSGSYEKTFTEDGRTYHHILDPHTGYPAESGLVSVTVWTPSVEEWTRPDADSPDEGTPAYYGAAADALSTACFVLGLEDSLPLLEEFGAQGLFVTEDGGVYPTEGLRESFTLEEGGGYTLLEELP